ncbi:MAG TPA: hypothetical protein VLX31_12325 [Streptosporangiaceae bacterium]|nr:hypothetical protein [Streptosporangiaceae bacterium]
MGLMIDRAGHSEEYEAIALPPAAGGGLTHLGPAVFLRRSARPSRRAVLHLHDLTGSFAPADLARWYNERGFHFYMTDVDTGELQNARRRGSRRQPACFAALDAACLHLREADGIDAIILSADGPAAVAAGLWCDARADAGPVGALILSGTDLGALRGSLDIRCPVLVIAAAADRSDRKDRRDRRGRDAVRLGQHVTWLYLDPEPGPDAAAGGAGAEQRKRMFDEMGRWLGAYMYGKVRDQLL